MHYGAKTRSLTLKLLLTTACLGWGGMAHAQTTASATQSEEPQVEADIVVTALKRDTTLQDTPISISAVSGDALQRAGTTDISTINTPSLNFVDGGPSQRRVVIRGIQAAGEPTIGVYYDETPVTGSAGSTNDAGANTPELRLFDVERVEVLRGPQGTLYGAGSMGGTLRIMYKKPVFEQEGASDLTLSSTEGGGFNYTINTMLNVPLQRDYVALRVSGFASRESGYIDNVALGIDNINRTRTWGGRAQLRVKPTDDMTLDLAAFLNHTRSDTTGWIAQAGRYNTDALTRQPLRDDFELYSGTLNWKLGGVTLTTILSYSLRHLATTSDVTRFIQGSRTAAACARLTNGNATCGSDAVSRFFNLIDSQIPSALAPDQNMETLTSEVRLSSNGNGTFNWTAGVFYSDRSTDIANPQLPAVAGTGALLYDRTPITVRLIDDDLKQAAAFAEASWDLTDRLNITGGIRYFHYERQVAGRTPIGNIVVGSRVQPLTVVSASENGSTVKLNASYKITPDIMLYADAAQGFRPGGVNQVIGLDPTLAPYRSDSVWNYEAGIKTSLFYRALTFNLDAFQIDWKDIQITGRTSNGAFSFITNAGAARVRGIEAEGTLRPMRGLSIQANGAYIDARLTENQSTVAVTAPGLIGDRIPFVPKLAGGANAQYEWGIGGGLTASVRGDLRHVGESLSDFRPTGTYTRTIAAYDLVNARIGVEKTSGWGIYLFATNLFDDVAITRATSSAILVGRTSVNSAPPRTIGVNLRTQF